MKTLTEAQDRWAFSANMDGPHELVSHAVTKSFVYDREYGLFYVSFGHHSIAMANILAWHEGFDNAAQAYQSESLKEKMNCSRMDSQKMAEYWIENYAGAAFRSSVARKIVVNDFNCLNEAEKVMFTSENARSIKDQ